MIAAALTVSAVGAASILLRGLPRAVVKFVVRHTTIEVAMTNSFGAFYDLMAWVEATGVSNSARAVRMRDGLKLGESTKGIGSGSHWLWYKGLPIRVTLTVESNTASYQERETVTLRFLGVGHRCVNMFLKDVAAQRSKADVGKTRIHVFRNGDWDRKPSQPLRDLKSVCIPAAQQKMLLDGLDKFLAAEEWYLRHGIPYKLGILLYGPPGTGKTSLIRAICGHLKLGIASVHMSGASSVVEALAKTPDNTVTVLEDIDTMGNSLNRDVVGKKNELLPTQGDTDDEDANTSTVSLSGLLNAIDGAILPHGRIIIMTTNKLEELDAALLRPGRIDIKVEVSYATLETLEMFLDRFFPGDAGLPVGCQIRERVSGADIQQLALEGKTKQEMLDILTTQQPQL